MSSLIRRILTTKYRPAPISAYVVSFLTFFLSIDAIVRGFDYLTKSPTVNVQSALVVVEKIGSYETWGIGFLFSGMLLLVARIVGSHFFVWLGHGLLAILYVVLAMALMQGAIKSMDNWRTLSILLQAVVHLVIAFGMRPLPQEWFDTRREEALE